MLFGDRCYIPVRRPSADPLKRAHDAYISAQCVPLEASLLTRCTGHMFGVILLAFSAFARAVSAGGAQVSLVVGNFEVYDAGLFVPVGDPHSLSTSAYVTLRHPLFPGHSVRIKQSHVCDEVVQ